MSKHTAGAIRQARQQAADFEKQLMDLFGTEEYPPALNDQTTQQCVRAIEESRKNTTSTPETEGKNMEIGTSTDMGMKKEVITPMPRFGVQVHASCPFCGRRNSLREPVLVKRRFRKPLVKQKCDVCGWETTDKAVSPKKERPTNNNAFLDGYMEAERKATGWVKKKPLRKRVRNFVATLAGGYFIHRQWGDEIPQWIGDATAFITGWLS